MTKNQASKSGSSEENLPSDSSPYQQSTQVDENQNEDEDQLPPAEGLQGSIQPNSGQFFQGPFVQWIPIQVQPAQNTSGSIERTHAESIGPGGGPTIGSGPNPGSGSGWSYPNHNLSGSTSLPYPGFGPGVSPFAGIPGGRPEPGDALYTAAGDGPQLCLISQ